MSSHPGSSPPPLDRALQEFLSASSPPAVTRRSQPVPPSAGRPVEPASPAVPQDGDPLRDAYERVLAHEAEKARTRVEGPLPLWRRLVMPALLFALLGATAYVWFGQPSWLAAPPHATLAKAQPGLAGQRQLVAIALQVEDFRRSTGRLPTRLEELGLHLPQFSYTPLPEGRYELHLGTGPHALSYVSRTDAEPEIREADTP